MTTKILIAAALVAAASPASAQQPPRLGKVLQERAVGKGKRELVPLPREAWNFDKGEYRSRRQGLVLKLPQLGAEKIVSVRESLLVRDPDGGMGMSQVVFVPEAQGAGVGRYGPVSAVLMTRLRPDAPHDRESIFKALEPRSDDERRKLQARGIAFRRVQTPLGEALQHVVPNRFVDASFASKVHVDQRAERVESVGVIRYVVAKDEAVLTLAQVLPCKGLAPDACRAAAERAAERFSQGLVSFELPKTPAPAAGASSAPKGK